MKQVRLPRLIFMAQVVPNAPQEFWRSPAELNPAVSASPISDNAVAACPKCGSEYMIGARFCHSCGERRLIASDAPNSQPGTWSETMLLLAPVVDSAAGIWKKISVPAWMHYLHFHSIKRWIGLPTASLIAFLIGLGCVAGAVGISLFFKASTLPEFQAIQMWRIEWLLAATASFVVGILLKTTTGSDNQ